MSARAAEPTGVASLAPDVVVIGGGMAGVMAALAAKTPVNRVLIVEPSNVLGGQGTAGGVAGFCGDTVHVNDEFRELIRRLSEHQLVREFTPTEDRRSYDLEWCAFFLQEMVLERGIDVLLHSRVTRATASDGLITRLEVSTVGGLYVLQPKFVVDATGACIVPAMAGFPVQHEGANKQLPMSLYFTMWNIGRKVRPILPPSCAEWTNDDEIPMTTLHCFDTGKVEIKMKVVGFDAADGLSFSQAEMHARRQMMSLIYYLQTRGYRGVRLDQHVLAGVSRHIGVRETRRIIGEHVLTVDDVTHGTVFPDAVAVGTYHLDYHWPDRMQRGDTGITTMVEPHHIPLRAMRPRGARNLLVPGRGASGDQMAMSSFRVMAPVSQMGFAAGKAAQLCAAQGVDLDALSIPELQQAIEQGGQRLDLSVYGEYLRNGLTDHEHVFGNERPFQQCHASTIVHLRNNRFLVAWFAGTAEGHPDVGIWAADRFQCRWSAPRRIAKVSDEPHWNPVVYRLADGRVRLHFRVGRRVAEWRSWSCESADEGATWSTPVELEVGEAIAAGPVRTKPIPLADGSWIAGNSDESTDQWRLVLERSVDGGRTWSQTAALSLEESVGANDQPVKPSEQLNGLRGVLNFEGRGVIQPALWESAPGRVHLFARSTAGAIYRSDSSDGGVTWAPLRRTNLPNNNSGLDVVRLREGALVLACNPVGSNWGARTPLRLSVSFDNGETWPHAFDIETGDGEFSYPSMIATPRGVALTYTWKRERIAFWHGSLEQLQDQRAASHYEEMLHSGIMP